MTAIRQFPIRLLCLLLGLVVTPVFAAPPRFTLHQVLQQVMDNYSALDVADLELKRARYEVDIVQRR